MFQRLTKIEEEKNIVETRKRKFLAEIQNAVMELKLQVQSSQKHLKQLNDGVQVCKLLFYIHVYVLHIIDIPRNFCNT